MTHRRFKGLLVGLGTMGSHHLRILRTLPGAWLCGVVDTRNDRRTAAAAARPRRPDVRQSGRGVVRRAA